jgi:hypothetical protein
MPCLAFRALAPALLAAVFCVPSLAEESGITAKLHPWGRFTPGTWKLVRAATETLDEQGQLVSTSTTEAKTVLVDVGCDGVTLEIEPCIEVAGKRFQAGPQTIKQGFHGELAAPGLKLSALGDAEVTIEDRKTPCKVERLELANSSEKTVTTVYYSTTVPPYVLKRTSVVTEPDGKVVSEMVVEVTALDMPAQVLGKMCCACHVKTVLKNAKGTTTTLAVVSPEVPGGVVSHSSKEVDKAGRVVRRSTLELVDFSADPDKDRNFHKRPNRRGKTSSR